MRQSATSLLKAASTFSRQSLGGDGLWLIAVGAVLTVVQIVYAVLKAGSRGAQLEEFVNEYLEMHQAAPVTIAKLRWLLAKATGLRSRGLRPCQDGTPLGAVA